MHEIPDRVISGLHSPNRLRRVTDYLYAKALFALPVSTRAKLFQGRDHFCPVCQSHIRGFLTLHRPYNAWCPVCRSLQRHRLVWLFFQQETNLFDPGPKRMLHIAPEPGFAARLRRLQNLQYLSADLNDPAAMVKMDLTQIEYPAGAFDVLYCSHVLEHIPDDRAAMREMFRVLSATGWAVIMVPLTAEATIEGPPAQNPAERERLFGQMDHVRRYGRDVVARLENAGFTIAQRTAVDMVKPPDIDRLGLSTKDVIFYCTKAPVPAPT
jgi:SAM-dependent methyltransferase